MEMKRVIVLCLAPREYVAGRSIPSVTGGGPTVGYGVSVQCDLKRHPVKGCELWCRLGFGIAFSPFAPIKITTHMNVDIPYGGRDDTARARVEWPKLAPYLGIGWGHQAEQDKGFGFIADLGVSFGSPRSELTISDPLRKKLDEFARVTGSSADDEIERQRRDLADDVETVKVFPHLFVGVSYRF